MDRTQEIFQYLGIVEESELVKFSSSISIKNKKIKKKCKYINKAVGINFKTVLTIIKNVFLIYQNIYIYQISDIWGEAEQAGALQPPEERFKGESYLSVPGCKVVKKTETVSFQSYLVKDKLAIGVWNKGNSAQM